jgi:YidC/Oxa1 family membrane protein insertase
MLKPFEDALLQLLNALYGVTHSYGLSIILLTVLVRIALLPLTVKQTRAQIDLQRIQPKVKELQKKYQKDKEKLQQELMKLYAEHKVNPFGGCLPLLVQLPIFWALFQMLITNKDIAKVGFLFIPSLGARPADYGFGLGGVAYLVILALLVITSYLPSRMLSNDPQQQTMMIIMSGLMAFIGWSLPGGVLLYWVTTNLLTIVQQYVQLKVVERGSFEQ